ncbi:MAG: hypothetical protein U0401_21875 [Anaerolineae bacterium]
MTWLSVSWTKLLPELADNLEGLGQVEATTDPRPASGITAATG